MYSVCSFAIGDDCLDKILQDQQKKSTRGVNQSENKNENVWVEIGFLLGLCGWGKKGEGRRWVSNLV